MTPTRWRKFLIYLTIYWFVCVVSIALAVLSRG